MGPRAQPNGQMLQTGAVPDTLLQENDKLPRPSRDINQGTISDQNRQSLIPVSTGPSGISIKCENVVRKQRVRCLRVD